MDKWFDQICNCEKKDNQPKIENKQGYNIMLIKMNGIETFVSFTVNKSGNLLEQVKSYFYI